MNTLEKEASDSMRRMPRVLVVAPSTKARGGIASVVRMHRSAEAWPEFSCRLLETFRGNSALAKALAASWAYVRAPFALLRADIAHFHIAAGTSALRKAPIVGLASL